jgi:hypothetical protein
MPITKGFTAKLVTIAVGSETIEVHVWPQNVADKCAVQAAYESAETDGVRGALSSAEFMHRMARKSDGSALFETRGAALDAMSIEQMNEACDKITEAAEAFVKESGLGNP